MTGAAWILLGIFTLPGLLLIALGLRDWRQHPRKVRFTALLQIVLGAAAQLPLLSEVLA